MGAARSFAAGVKVARAPAKVRHWEGHGRSPRSMLNDVRVEISETMP